MKELPTQEYLKECFNYDSDTGLLTWRERPRHHFCSTHTYKIFKTRFSGKIAGYVNIKNKSPHYLNIGINGKILLAHRLIWVLLYGYEPEQIDHIDGNGSNNKLRNLRNVTHAINSKNRKKNKNNKSGITGVYFHMGIKRWIAKITVNRKIKYIGCFKNKIDAIIVRKMAEYEHGFHVNHGREQ